MSDGAKWHSRRKLLTPAFHFSILEEFCPIFNEVSSTFVRILKDKYGDGTIFDVFSWSSRLSLDIICGESHIGKTFKLSNFLRMLFLQKLQWEKK